MTQGEFNAKIKKRNIQKVAKRFGVDWHFKRRYTSKYEIQSLVKECQSLDTFSIFLEESYDTLGYRMISDYDNTIEIILTTKNNTQYRYQGKYPNVGMQPWYDWTDKTLLVDQLYLPRCNYNFNTNTRLIKILPNDFLNINTITERSIFEGYIIWYLKRKKIIF